MTTPTRIGDILPDAARALGAPIELDTLNAAVAKVGDDLVKNGRYVFPHHPVTGKATARFQRVTNFAKLLDDGFGLERWRLRKTLRGLVARDDLYLSAAAAGEDDEALDRIAESAQEAAGSTSGRDKGTALHTLVERINRGEDGVTAPAGWAADLHAYRAEVARIGLTPHTVEAVVVNTRFDVAGRCDLIATVDGYALPLIADLKTGSVDAAALSIAVQMACYATADFTYDPATETFSPMPEVDTDTALIIHLPAGEGTCRTLRVPLEEAIERAELAAKVRVGRRGVAKLLVPFEAPVDTAAPTPAAVDTTAPTVSLPPDNETWIRQRIVRVGHHADARTRLGQLWPEGVPTPKNMPADGWTDAHLVALDAALSAVEASYGIEPPTAPAFPPWDPAEEAARDAKVAGEWAPVVHEPDTAAPVRDLDDGEAMEPDDVAAIQATARSLPTDRRSVLAGWARDGKSQGRPWAGSVLHHRTFEISRAAIACVEFLWDDDDPDALVRCALAAVLGEDLQPTWRTGAVLGSLCTSEATRLADIAARFAADDDAVVTDLGNRLAATA